VRPSLLRLAPGAIKDPGGPGSLIAGERFYLT
jgi:hypothetical protein